VPLATIIGVFSREIASVVLGEEFREGHTIIPFVVGGVAVWGLAMIGHKGLEIAEKTRTMLLLVIVAAAANIALNFILIPKYGYNGAAFATCLSYTVYPVLAWWATRSLVPWRIPWGSALRIVVAAIVMGGASHAVVRFLPDSVPTLVALAAAALVGIALYLGTLLLIRELKPHELRTPRG
jgi:O-antigen/teichoic acid export membrane protein